MDIYSSISGDLTIVENTLGGWDIRDNSDDLLYSGDLSNVSSIQVSSSQRLVTPTDAISSLSSVSVSGPGAVHVYGVGTGPLDLSTLSMSTTGDKSVSLDRIIQHYEISNLGFAMDMSSDNYTDAFFNNLFSGGTGTSDLEKASLELRNSIEAFFGNVGSDVEATFNSYVTLSLTDDADPDRLPLDQLLGVPELSSSYFRIDIYDNVYAFEQALLSKSNSDKVSENLLLFGFSPIPSQIMNASFQSVLQEFQSGTFTFETLRSEFTDVYFEDRAIAELVGTKWIDQIDLDGFIIELEVSDSLFLTIDQADGLAVNRIYPNNYDWGNPDSRGEIFVDGFSGTSAADLSGMNTYMTLELGNQDVMFTGKFNNNHWIDVKGDGNLDISSLAPDDIPGGAYIVNGSTLVISSAQSATGFSTEGEGIVKVVDSPEPDLPSLPFSGEIPIGTLIDGYDRDVIWEDANLEINDEIHGRLIIEDFWGIGSVVAGVHHNLYLGIDGLETSNGNIVAGELTFIGVTLDDGPLDDTDDFEPDLVKISGLNIELSEYFETTNLANVNIDTTAFNNAVFSGDNIVSLSSEDDVVYGGSGDDTLSGGAGDDTLEGSFGGDTLKGGDGNDILYGGAGDDSVDGGDGEDIIQGGPGNDTIYGRDGNDRLYGNYGSDGTTPGTTPELLSLDHDIIYGGAGDDYFEISHGSDSINGGDGIDTAGFDYVATGLNGGVLVNLTDNIQGSISANSYVLSDGSVSSITSVEAIGLSNFDDVLYNDEPGNSFLRAGSDNAHYYAGNYVVPGSGADKIFAYVNGVQVVYDDDGNDGAGAIISGINVVYLNGIATVIDGWGDKDTLTDVFDIIGTSFNDEMIGDGNSQYFSGGAGNDNLGGGDGDDTLDGGAGDDTLTGGDGSDTFVFRGVFDHDVINDFDEDIDALEFYASDGTTILASDLVESTDADGNRVLSTFDGLSSVTFSGQSITTPTLPAFDIALASEVNGTATFAVYANELVDPDSDGIGSFEFALSHDPSDLLIDADSIAAASGISNVPNYDPLTGVMENAAFALPNFTDLSTPIVTFNATILDTDTPIDLSITNAIVDRVDQDDMVETFDFSSVSITATTVDRFGDDLVLSNDDVFAFEISGGNQLFVREGDGSDTNTVIEIVANPTSEFSALDFDLTDYAGLTDFTLSDALSNWTVQTNTTVADQVSFSGFSNSAEIPAGQETVLATFTTAIDPDFDISGIKLDGAAEPDVAVGEIPAASTNGNVTVFEVSSGTGAFVNAYKPIDAASEDAIGAYDALQALRLAVGLTKSDGTAEWHDYLAADINKDGRVGADDALDILKFAVGLTDGSSADWIFVDGDADWSGIGRRDTSYDEGVMLEDVLVDTSINMTGILVGDLDGSYVA